MELQFVKSIACLLVQVRGVGQMDVSGSVETHVYMSLGRSVPAAEHFTQALTLFRRIGGRDGEAWALNGLGEAAGSTGQFADALVHHTGALNVAAETGAIDQQARAHAGLGHAHRRLGDPALARAHYERAVTLYAGLGMPEVDQIRAHLATVTTPSAGGRVRA